MPTELRMPELGESVLEGTVSKWLKQEGESVAEYEPLLEVSTDKVDTEIPAPVSGVLQKILVAEGETVAIDTPLCLIADSSAGGDAGPATEAEPVSEPVSAPVPEPALSAENGQTAKTASAPAHGQRSGPHITPVVARIAAEHNVNLALVSGSGLGGRVTKKDILAYIEGKPETPPAPPVQTPIAPQPQPIAVQPLATPAPAPAGPALPFGEIIPFTGMRKSIADHMVLSKRTSPHVTSVMEVDCSAMVNFYQQNKNSFQQREGLKLTFTPIFVSAIIDGLKAVPIVNSVLTEKGIELKRDINIGVAVALDDGLIVPVIKNADGLNLTGLQRAVTDLATRARSKRLSPADVQGGTFTLSNHGISGSLFATPIINQPQVGILGVGKIEKRVVVVTHNNVDSIAIKPMCYISFTFDHRILDGAVADSFLSTVKQSVENWP